MNSLTFFLSSRLGLASACIGQGIMIVVLGLSTLPAGANPLADSFDVEDASNQTPVALIETDAELAGDRQIEAPIADTTNSSVEESVITTKENIPPFPQTESSAVLLLPSELTELTADKTENPLLTQVIEESTTDSPEPESNDEQSKIESENPWTFKLQPYATIPLSTYGNSTVKGRTVDYHLNLGELLDILKVAVSGRFEAWYNDFGFIIEGYYANLGGSGITSFESLPNANIQSALTFEQGIYDFAFSYRLGDSPPNRLSKEPSQLEFPLIWFEPIAGVRLNSVNTSLDELTINVGDNSASLPLDRVKTSQGRTWFEPMLGGKLGIQVSEPIAFWLRGDASGFGIAGDTDLSWNLLAGIDWWVGEQTSLQIGYRFYEINYGNGSGNGEFGFKESLNGPFIAATFNF